MTHPLNCLSWKWQIVLFNTCLSNNDISSDFCVSLYLYTAGVKKSLVLEPGTSKISIRTSIYFHPMSDGQVKNIQ